MAELYWSAFSLARSYVATKSCTLQTTTLSFSQSSMSEYVTDQTWSLSCLFNVNIPQDAPAQYLVKIAYATFDTANNKVFALEAAPQAQNSIPITNGVYLFYATVYKPTEQYQSSLS